MKTLCHELGQDGRLSAVALSDALERWRKQDGAFWLDLEAYDETSLHALLTRIEVNEFLKQRCLRSGLTTVVVSGHQGTFVNVMVFADRSCTRRVPVSALALRNLLITMKSEPIEEPVSIPDAIHSLEMSALNTESVLCAVLFEYAMVTGRQAHALRESVLEIGERMDRDVESVDPEELEDLVHSILLTLAVADEQAEAFALLPNARSDGFHATEIQSPLGLLDTGAASTERLARRLDDRMENLVRRKQDYKQVLLNRRIAMLTILSAIFMPLTLLTGIWGMNFEHMPELDDPYAYPAALGLMATLGLGGAWAFYKRGWFG
jgi:magnesium transporter